MAACTHRANTVQNHHVEVRQCGGSGMFIPDPGSWFLPITDPGSKNSNKRERCKKKFCHNFYVVTNFTKLQIILVLKFWRKKIWANFQRIIELFTLKIVTKLSKIWVWDPGSEIRDPEKTYSGSRIQGSKRHRIPDPEHCMRGWSATAIAEWSLIGK
jgi:hypothetical protein